MWTKVVESGLIIEVVGISVSFEAPVISETDTEKKRPNEPESTAFVTASTSLVVVAVVAVISKKTTITRPTHVSRKSSSARRRKGTVKSPGRIQARDRREICAEILHPEPRWNCCSSVSLRGMGADRAE